MEAERREEAEEGGEGVMWWWDNGKGKKYTPCDLTSPGYGLWTAVLFHYHSGSERHSRAKSMGWRFKKAYYDFHSCLLRDLAGLIG